ncbi:hypothetical protein T03_14134 [Trichinella britovi]|uniref:Uncharacterized protein n=1 Tax=Trichinella britovi TaxID=45882 RepID=A0A0V1DD81_TRIBR|nr:hypothetical protein T03_14134 [Trichinella britovi]
MGSNEENGRHRPSCRLRRQQLRNTSSLWSAIEPVQISHNKNKAALELRREPGLRAARDVEDASASSYMPSSCGLFDNNANTHCVAFTTGRIEMTTSKSKRIKKNLHFVVNSSVVLIQRKGLVKAYYMTKQKQKQKAATAATTAAAAAAAEAAIVVGVVARAIEEEEEEAIAAAMGKSNQAQTDRQIGTSKQASSRLG